MTATQFGRYEIESTLGQGGMATVYLARDPRFGRQVALKVMSYQYKDDPTFRGRFEREARTVATLEHPAIVPVYDFGEDHDQLYLVMRYMPGGSLSDRIVRKPFTLEESVPIVQRIAAALDHAHAQGVIHRDLKPANILFDQYDNAFLSDFGIVKIAAEATTTGYTGSGVIGTPAYMSPEQIHGDTKLDGRSDLYTLGVILFEMLTGVKPYRAETPVKQMMAHVLNPIPSIRTYKPELPSECEKLMQKVLAKEREARFASGIELTQALTLTATGQRPAPYLTPLPNADAPGPIAAPVGGVAETETAVPVVEPPPVSAAVDRDAETQINGTAVDPATVEASTRRRFPWWGIVVGILVIGLLGGGLFYIPTLNSGNEPPMVTSAPVAVAGVETPLAPTPTGSPMPTNAATAAASATPTSRAPVSGERFVIGRSVSGAPIEAMRLGEGPRAVVLVGGIHAGFAPASVTVAEQTMDYFEDNLAEIPDGVTLYIVPNVNPDSEEAPGELAGRVNANDVDLNRNWDCNWRADPVWRGVPGDGLGGTAPFSEPEVVALRDFILEQDAKAVIFWQARVSGGLVSPGTCTGEPLVSSELAAVYGQGAAYPVTLFEALVDQAINGDSTNWLDSQGVAAISVLLPDYDDPDWEQNLAGIRAVLDWYGGE